MAAGPSQTSRALAAPLVLTEDAPGQPPTVLDRSTVSIKGKMAAVLGSVKFRMRGGAGGGSSGHSEKSPPSKRRRAGGQHESRAACSRYSPCSGEGSAGATGSVALCTPTRTGRLHPHKAMARTSPPPSPPPPRSKQSAILAAPNHLTAATAADSAIPTLPSAGSGWTGTAAVAAAGSVVGPVGCSDDGNLRGSPGPGELGEDASYAEQLEWAIQESLLSSAREAFRTQAATKAESGDSVIDLT